MNFQQLKNISLFLTFIAITATNCGTKNSAPRVIEILVAFEVSNSKYEYSDESNLNLMGKLFSLRYRAIYNNHGIIIKLSKYTTEGIVVYSNDQLKKDTLILNEIDIPFSQTFVYENGKICSNNGSPIVIQQVTNDTLLIQIANKATIYKIKSLPD
jgi:hypothetical protein